MKNRLKNINFYLTSIATGSGIDAVSETGSFIVNDVTVSGYQLTDGGNQLFWVVVDANLENNRELFRITNVNLSTKTLTYDKRVGPNGKKTHDVAALVQINDVAELFNHIANTIDDFGMAEIILPAGLAVRVFGGEVRSNGIAATVPDTTVTFTDNLATVYLVFDYIDNSFKQATTLQSNHALLYQLTTSGGQITSFLDKRGLSFGITTASAIPVFTNAAARDIALPSPSDGMQVCLTTDGVYTDYLNGAWIARGSAATPNASTTVAGKTEIATDEQITAGTGTGETGAILVPTPTQIKKSISLKNSATTIVDTNEFGINVSGEDKRLTYANLKTKLSSDYTASETVAGFVERATDAEALAGTDTTRYITPYHLVYGNSVSASDALKVSSDTERFATSGIIKTIRCGYIPFGGTLRIKFDGRNYSDTYYGTAQIFRNGVAVGTSRVLSNNSPYQTFSEDISGWNTGDLIQINLWSSHGYHVNYIRNFRIYFDYTTTTRSFQITQD